MKIIDKFMELIRIIINKLLKFIKAILVKLVEMLNMTLKKFKAIRDEMMKIFKNFIKKIKSLKSKYDPKRLIILLAIFIELFLITWWALPDLIFKLFGVVRSNIIQDTSGYLTYRCISMPIIYLLRGFIQRTIKELIENYSILGILSIICTVIVFVIIKIT